jgi:hypothetical protein
MGIDHMPHQNPVMAAPLTQHINECAAGLACLRTNLTIIVPRHLLRRIERYVAWHTQRHRLNARGDVHTIDSIMQYGVEVPDITARVRQSHRPLPVLQLRPLQRNVDLFGAAIAAVERLRDLGGKPRHHDLHGIQVTHRSIEHLRCVNARSWRCRVNSTFHRLPGPRIDSRGRRLTKPRHKLKPRNIKHVLHCFHAHLVERLKHRWLKPHGRNRKSLPPAR